MKSIKFLTLLVGIFFSLTLISCTKDSKTDEKKDYTIAEAQLMKDYGAYSISKITWLTQREYQIASFSIQTKSTGQSITAWYSVSGEDASREMDSEDLGTTVPEKIKVAFMETEYSNDELWKVEEIELEHNYNDNGVESYYEMELENRIDKNLEAELFFDYKTGKLLYAKEELDNGDDSDDDKFVINDQLVAAVEAEFPGAKIIDAEIDDNLIEVDAIITEAGISKEIEIKFSMNYKLVSSETETEFSYSQLPAEFNVIKEWFTNNPTIPAPIADTEVEITEGEQFEDDYDINYFYEVEIDEYDGNDDEEYEIKFFLDKDRKIIAVIVNDVKHDAKE